MQVPESSFIKDGRIIHAKNRSYIQGYFGDPMGKHLVVEITEKMSKNHQALINIIAKKIDEGGCTKAMAIQLRRELLETHGG